VDVLEVMPLRSDGDTDAEVDEDEEGRKAAHPRAVPHRWQRYNYG